MMTTPSSTVAVNRSEGKLICMPMLSGSRLQTARPSESSAHSAAGWKPALPGPSSAPCLSSPSRLAWRCNVSFPSVSIVMLLILPPGVVPEPNISPQRHRGQAESTETKTGATICTLQFFAISIFHSSFCYFCLLCDLCAFSVSLWLKLSPHSQRRDAEITPRTLTQWDRQFAFCYFCLLCDLCVFFASLR